MRQRSMVAPSRSGGPTSDGSCASKGCCTARDMAVGTMLISNRSFVKAGGPPVSLILNKADEGCLDVLVAENFVYVGGQIALWW